MASRDENRLHQFCNTMKHLILFHSHFLGPENCLAFRVCVCVCACISFVISVQKMAITSRFKILNFSHILKMDAHQSHYVAVQFIAFYIISLRKRTNTNYSSSIFKNKHFSEQKEQSLLKSFKIKINVHEKTAGIRKKRVSFPLWMESTTHVQVNQYSLEHCIKECFLFFFFFFFVRYMH